ncbi:hypothetical protein CISG_09213 [Coccidioides immitis RMSCC 3703]|uniref:Uncharacterized protein n=1 Tax=Coccidioides immitis RMSCC 3703 TaxID=454286 RepID=A0A0J8RB34_COCIT|nr:hypothetical protein CISG_09213 [Coccidioides immitis RMSCC 3703]
MEQLMFTDVETQLSKEHNLKYQRTAKAGEQVLLPSDQWWTVDLYLDALVDEYSNKQPPSDGEVYQKVRQYEYEANTCHKDCWITCLSENKAKCLQQLLHHDHIWAGFDSLLVIPELWSGMNIGSLHQVITLNCDEEVIHYLGYVKKFWFSLVEGNLSKMMKINLHTVEALELLAPGVSHKDAKTMQGLVLRVANCLKQLISLDKFTPTLWRAFLSIYNPLHDAGANYPVQRKEEKNHQWQEKQQQKKQSSGAEHQATAAQANLATPQDLTFQSLLEETGASDYIQSWVGMSPIPEVVGEEPVDQDESDSMSLEEATERQFGESEEPVGQEEPDSMLLEETPERQFGESEEIE